MITKILLSMPFMMSAINLFSSEVVEEAVEKMEEDLSSLNPEAMIPKVENDWKTYVLNYWDMMQTWQKVVVAVVLALLVIWLLSKLFILSSGCCKGDK